MRPRGRALPAGAGAAHGIAHALVGIGDGADRRSDELLERFARAPDGSFLWTRDDAGAFRLGRIAGPLRFDDAPAAREIGLPHVRPATWLDRRFAEHEVPGAVAATFARGGLNFQQIRNAAAERDTAALWGAPGACAAAPA